MVQYIYFRGKNTQHYILLVHNSAYKDPWTYSMSENPPFPNLTSEYAAMFRWEAVNKMAAEWIKRMETLVEMWKKQAETAEKVRKRML